MTIEAILTLLPYLTPVVLLVAIDIIGDLLPGKYVGKLRKFVRYLRLIQVNKGMEAKNRLEWNIIDGKVAAVKSMILSQPFDQIASQFQHTINGLVQITEEMAEKGILPKEALQQYLDSFNQQAGIAKNLQGMFDETIGRKQEPLTLYENL